jgi:hypothetical protein
MGRVPGRTGAIMSKDILVHPDMKDVVLDKEKTITIRKGIRNYKPGDRVKVGCDSYGWFPVRVTDVDFCALGDVSYADLTADGFATFKDMRIALQKFYPDIDYHTDVTIIRWEYE